MNDFRKVEIKLDELSEDFNEHVVTSKSTYYHVMGSQGDFKQLSLNVYSRGGEIECEVLLLPDFSNAGEVTCNVTLDGEAAGERSGVITISPLQLSQGYHTLSFLTNTAVAAARVRLTGVLSSSIEAEA
ncbi:MAG: hypothetical protein K2N57_06720 [Clostridia bacterium]|nr:hypothetical protein [Clostridia bacterium]